MKKISFSGVRELFSRKEKVPQKISFTDVLESRRKFKILGVLVVLLVAAVAVQVFVLKNPKDSKAAGWNAVTNTLTIDAACASAVLTRDSTTTQKFTYVSDASHLCGNIAPNPFPLPENANIIITGVTVKTTSVEGSSLKLGSLTIDSGGKLTHPDITPAVISAWPSTLTATGKSYKVDLVVNGNITLNGTGSIDVSGNGYPDNASYTSGYGPGGGIASAGNGAGGGSYGGKGGKGWVNDNGTWTPSGAVYGDIYNPNDWGSGGGKGGAGVGNETDNDTTDNGDGGGLIKLQAKTLTINDTTSTILADGTDSANLSDGSDKSGGGSGGTIFVKVDMLNIPTTTTAKTPIFSAKGGFGGTNGEFGGWGGGGRIAIYANYLTSSASSFYNLCRYYSSDVGACFDNATVPTNQYPQVGTIYLSVNHAQKVNKYLQAVDRAGTDAFNPYALMVNDIIQVHIIVADTTPGVPITVSDDWLETPSGTRYCKPLAYSGATYPFSPSPDSWPTANSSVIPPNPVVWTNYVPTSSPTEFYYQCQVQ